MEKQNFGSDQLLKITEPLDTWLSAGLRDYAVPEAVGSSARVFNLQYPPLTGAYGDTPAIKIMRPDNKQYALPLFRSEAYILDQLKDVPGITPMLGLGFLKVVEGIWPHEIAPLSTSLAEEASAVSLAGEADLFLPEETDLFLTELQERVSEDWLAFIILPRRWEDNLYLRCDAGYTRGEFHRTYPVAEALQAAIQMCEIMHQAHKKNIVYLDHKILHYYWNQPRQQVFVLDWNIGRAVTNGNAQEVFAFDILQFSARALHHLMAGRQAPGSVKVGPNRPEDIQNAPDRYEPVWTFDDQERLTADEMDTLGKAIQGYYQTAENLSQALKSLHQQRQSLA